MKNLRDRKFLLIQFSALLLFFLGIAVYYNILKSPFQFDDIKFIVENRSIRGLSNPLLIWEFLPTRFVDFFSLAVNYHFAKLDVFSYHLFNLFLHLMVSMLVFWFAWLIFSTPIMKKERLAQYKGEIALFISLFFLVHPIQTESVTYVHQRSTCLAGMFYLSSLCLYVTARLWGIDGKLHIQRRILYILAYMLALAGMFTRENTITLPLAVLLFEFYFFRVNKQIRWLPAAPFLITLPVIPITMFLSKPITLLHIQKLADSPVKGWYYFLTQLNVKITYLRLFFFPLKQNFDYDYPVSRGLFELPTLISLIVLILILVIAVRIFRKYKILSFAVFWFFLTLLPESSFIPQPDVISEHRLYLPAVGFCVFSVCAMYYMFVAKNRKLLAVLLSAIVVIFSVLTFRRNIVWKDEISLWNDTIGKSPDKARPYNERGNAYADRGSYAKAIADFNKAVEIDAKVPFNIKNPLHSYSIRARIYYNRANTYQKMGDFEQALSDYSRSIEINNKNAGSYNNRAIIYAKKNEYDQAVSDLSQAIKIDPNFILAYSNRAALYMERHKYPEAISDFSKAIQIDPNFIEAYYGRAVAYLNMDNLQQASLDFEKVKRLEGKPGGRK
ncbi:MAG: tetratricopeptide repeat protein [Candidatus Omnitrophica bacterium]|nr:tetratricopeptide repeat protein [Candidatus Omnitrophota bacterium]MDD5690769.1 tetratricopeptide repeat protein [Candidatus Omnitrophota bacterium]